MTTAIAGTTEPEAPVRVGPPSRLEILRHARELALDVGAVAGGFNYFEDADGKTIEVTGVAEGRVSPDAVCGVCIAGACVLAEVLLVGKSDWERYYFAALDRVGPNGTTIAITEGGTEYVVAVLDQMIADEEAARE